MEKKTVSQKVKGHLKRNKDKYIIGGVFLVVGGTVGVYLGNKGIINIQLVNTGSVTQVQNIDKSINVLTRRGHAGNIIRRNSDGKTWSSQRQLCKDLGIDPRDLWRHLKRQADNINGETYDKIGSFNVDES